MKLKRSLRISGCLMVIVLLVAAYYKMKDYTINVSVIKEGRTLERTALVPMIETTNIPYKTKKEVSVTSVKTAAANSTLPFENQVSVETEVDKANDLDYNKAGSTFFAGFILGSYCDYDVELPLTGRTASALRYGLTMKEGIEQIYEESKLGITDLENYTNPSEEVVIDLFKKMLALPNNAGKLIIKKKCTGPSATACINTTCTQQLETDLGKRVRNILRNPSFKLTKPQNDFIHDLSKQIPENDIIILSATSSNHLDELKSMIRNLREAVLPQVKNYTFVIWDVGLTEEEFQEMKRCCGCHVARFPFHKLTSYTRDVRSFSWKPMIIRASLLKARRYVLYQDSSFRYNKDYDFVALQDRGEKYGVQLLRYPWGIAEPIYTLPSMFTFMNYSACTFHKFPQLFGGYGIYHKDPLVMRTVSEPWARCAFEKDCISPVFPKRGKYCKGKPPAKYGICHRFDQSALTAITAALYNDDIWRVIVPDFRGNFGTNRKVEPSYFNTTGCLNKA